MSRLVVMAHYDVDRILRPHTLRTLENYAQGADRVIVVSTSGLDHDSASRLPDRVELVTRRNFGYDFFSYKWGLDVATDYGDFDRILICNDSFIGPTVPLQQILDSEAVRAHDLTGMTVSRMHGAHAQSFFMVVNSYVARSNAFRRFWKDMVPVSDRMRVISDYEVGFSRTLTRAGFSLGAYFVPTKDEEELADQRYRWFTTHRLDKDFPDKTISELHRFDLAAKPWNPAVAYADRICLDDRLPLLKFDTLRYDPYELGATRLLSRCLGSHPIVFGDIPEFLKATRDRYPRRPGEFNLSASEQELREARVGYLLDDMFSANAREVAG